MTNPLPGHRQCINLLIIMYYQTLVLYLLFGVGRVNRICLFRVKKWSSHFFGYGQQKMTRATFCFKKRLRRMACVSRSI